MIFESIDRDGRRTAEHLNLETPNVNSPLKNVIVLVRQNQPDPRMDVYIDCVYQGAIPLRKSFRKLADNEDNSLVEAVSFCFTSRSMSPILLKIKCDVNIICTI